MLPFFEPYVRAGEIRSLPSYNFYAQIASKVPQEPVSGETLLNEPSGSERVARHAIAESRANYAKKIAVVEETAGEQAKPHATKADKLKQTRTRKPKHDEVEPGEFPGGAEPQVSG